MIRPARPAARIRAAMPWLTKNAASRLTAVTASQSASPCSRMSARRMIPALLTRMSTRPKAATARSGSAFAASRRSEVGLERGEAAAERQDRSFRLGHRLRAGADDVGPGGGQRLGDAAAEPGARTGHQRHLAREVEQVRGHRISASATGSTSLYSWFSPVMPQTKA